MTSFVPKLKTLPHAQRALWSEMRGLPPEFVLYGGTAIAFHLGHRESIDFDFFGTRDFNPTNLYRQLAFLKGAQVLQQAKNTLTCSVDRGDPVKVSFFGLPGLKRIEEPGVASDNDVKVASLIDLAGMKAAVVQERAEAKDYLDLDALMQHGIGLATALAAAAAIYGESYNPQITLKALSYFDDGNLRALSQEVRQRLVDAVAEVDLGKLPTLKRGTSE